VDANGDAIKQWVVVPKGRSGASSASPVTVNADGRTSYTVRVGGMGLEPTMFAIEAVNRGPGVGAVGSTASHQIAYPQPRITKATWKPGDNSAVVAITTNLPAGSPVTYEYSRDGGEFTEFDGKVVPNLVNGQRHTIRLRLQLEALTSAEYRLEGVQPRSTVPPAPTVIRKLLLHPGLVVLSFDKSLQATEGWDYSDYRFCATSGTKCSLSASDPRAEIGGERTVKWSVGGHDAQFTVTIADVKEPTRSGSTVEAKFPYVENGTCTITATGKKGGKVEETVSDAGGQLAFTKSYDQIPVPGSDPAAVEAADEISIACMLNGNPDLWTYK